MARPPKRPPTAPYTYDDHRTKISDVEIAQAAYNAGFRGDALITAVAVAIAESHGNTTAVNDRREFSVGLWQINVNGYLSKRLQRWGFDSWIDLWEPDKNAQAAYSLSRGGTKWGLWSTYKHGAHLKFMERATTAANALNTQSPATGSTSTPATNTTRVPQFHGVQPSNILPASNVNVSDPTVAIVLIAVVGVIVVGLLLMTRKRSE